MYGGNEILYKITLQKSKFCKKQPNYKLKINVSMFHLYNVEKILNILLIKSREIQYF